MSERMDTSYCVGGGGPTGMMLAFLLALGHRCRRNGKARGLFPRFPRQQRTKPCTAISRSGCALAAAPERARGVVYSAASPAIGMSTTPNGCGMIRRCAGSLAAKPIGNNRTAEMLHDRAKCARAPRLMG